MRTLAERGLARTTLVDVAAAAEVSVGLVQRYFRSKDELLLFGIEHVYRRVGERVRQVQVTTPVRGFVMLLTLGADAALLAVRALGADVPATTLKLGQLALGVAVIAASYWLEARARRQEGEPGKVQRWRVKAMTGSGSTGALMSLALPAALLEVATMLPYLAAVGLIADADLGWQLLEPDAPGINYSRPP
ncbi:helix-turn-helix domain-containing protein [Nonomuraea sp. NPDC003214]